MLAVPLLGSHEVHRVLTAARRTGRPAFTAKNLDMAAGFAHQAAVALDLPAPSTSAPRCSTSADRIAADLHDHVIQRLFATGLSLQSVAATLEPGKARTRVLSSITDLDDTISQIRTSIFQLRQVTRSEQSGVRARMLDVVSELTPALGFEPAVRFSGVFEDVLPDAVVEDLLAVLREALSNVARHARARSTTVTATTTPGRLTLQVNDDGAGIGPTTRRSGLANLARRAEHHGGTLTVAPNTPTGTQLTWTVPLS